MEINSAQDSLLTSVCSSLWWRHSCCWWVVHRVTFQPVCWQLLFSVKRFLPMQAFCVPCVASAGIVVGGANLWLLSSNGSLCWAGMVGVVCVLHR